MYGIFTYIYHKNQPNVGKYTIHGYTWMVRVMKIRPIVEKTSPCPYATTRFSLKDLGDWS